MALDGYKRVDSYIEMYRCDYCNVRKPYLSSDRRTIRGFVYENGTCVGVGDSDYCSEKCYANGMLYNYDKHRWPSIKIYNSDIRKHVAMTDPDEAYEYLREGLSAIGTWQFIDEDIKEYFKEYLNTNIKDLA